MLVLACRVLFHCEVFHHGTNAKVKNKMPLLGYDNDSNPDDPMLLLTDNSDSPSIVEQLSQGPSLS